MTVAEDAIITEEALVAEEVLVVKEVQAAEEVSAAIEILVVDSEAIEVQLLEAVDLDLEKKAVLQTEPLVKVVLAEEANREVHQHQDVKVVFHPIVLQEDQMLRDLKDFQKELRDVQKVLQILQEKEDQEKAKPFC